MSIKKCISFLVLISLQFISAKLNIDIKPGASASDTSIEYSGADVIVVTDHEIDLFGMDARRLNAAVKAYFDGKSPTDVFLKSPTPWGDLYKTYGWEQVSRALVVKSAKVKAVTRNPTVLVTKDFENHHSNPIKVNAGISQTVENTFTTTWATNKDISVSQEVSYGVNIIFGQINGSTGLSFTSSWGKSESITETVTIGDTTAVEIELQPGQVATASITASIGFVEVEVVYAAFLRGNVAVNFRRQHNGHHFWGPTVDTIMKSGEINNELTTTQMIKIGFHSDVSLKVFDKATGRSFL